MKLKKEIKEFKKFFDKNERINLSIYEDTLKNEHFYSIVGINTEITVGINNTYIKLSSIIDFIKNGITLLDRDTHYIVKIKLIEGSKLVIDDINQIDVLFRTKINNYIDMLKHYKINHFFAYPKIYLNRSSLKKTIYEHIKEDSIRYNFNYIISSKLFKTNDERVEFFEKLIKNNDLNIKDKLILKSITIRELTKHKADENYYEMVDKL